MTKAIVFLLVLLVAAPAALAVQINEIRIDQPASDTDEYFELMGEPGESLDGLTYVTIGDGAGGSGVVEAVVDLTGLTIQDDGLLCINEVAEVPIAECAAYDLALSLNFENSDNVTHLLVTGFIGAPDDDIDADDDGVIDNPLWDSVVDCVALIEEIDAGDLVYCDNQVGPDGTFVPGHVFRCEGDWYIGLFDLCLTDTPGNPNDPACEPVPTEDRTWSGVKGLYR